ncbi:MAG: hypothetical protein K0S76_2299 [Herbinix sp.]|nr:hypothetical protein [Herbinix sp.]
MKKKLSILILAVLSVMIMLAGCGTKEDTQNPGSDNDGAVVDQNDNQNEDDSQAEGDDQEEPVAENTFKVGLEAGYPPFNWTMALQNMQVAMMLKLLKK